jgi:hypothetical protein
MNITVDELKVITPCEIYTCDIPAKYTFGLDGMPQFNLCERCLKQILDKGNEVLGIDPIATQTIPVVTVEESPNEEVTDDQIAKQLEEETPKNEAQYKVDVKVEYTKKHLESLSFSEIKDIAIQNKLPVFGNKETLIDRILSKGV